MSLDLICGVSSRVHIYTNYIMFTTFEEHQLEGICPSLVQLETITQLRSGKGRQERNRLSPGGDESGLPLGLSTPL